LFCFSLTNVWSWSLGVGKGRCENVSNEPSLYLWSLYTSTLSYFWYNPYCPSPSEGLVSFSFSRPFPVFKVCVFSCFPHWCDNSSRHHPPKSLHNWHYQKLLNFCRPEGMDWDRQVWPYTVRMPNPMKSEFFSLVSYDFDFRPRVRL
jgi:hypothetical protein